MKEAAESRGYRGWFAQVFAGYLMETQRTAEALDVYRDHLRPGRYKAQGSVAFLDQDDERSFVARHRLGPSSEALSAPLVTARVVSRLLGRSRVALQLEDGAGRVQERSAGAEGRQDAEGTGGKEETDESLTVQGFRGSVLVLRPRKSLIMDLDRGAVLHSYGSNRHFEAHAHRPRELLSCFPAPETWGVEPVGRSLVERLTQGRLRHEWGSEIEKEARRVLAEAVLGEFELAARKGSCLRDGRVRVDEVRNRLAEFPEYQRLGARMDKVFGLDRAGEVSFPLVHGHGDVRLSNMVCEEEGFVFLDWEFSRLQPFVFDLLHWLFMEVRYHRDPEPLRRYLMGESDGLMKEAFSKLGEEYDPRLRRVYLGVYLVDRILDRSRDVDGPGRARRGAFNLRLFEGSLMRRAFSGDGGRKGS